MTRLKTPTAVLGVMLLLLAACASTPPDRQVLTPGDTRHARVGRGVMPPMRLDVPGRA